MTWLKSILKRSISKYCFLLLLLIVIYYLKSHFENVTFLGDLAIGIIASGIVLAAAEYNDYERAKARNKRVYTRAVYGLKLAASDYDDYLKEKYYRSDNIDNVSFDEWFDKYEKELSGSAAIEVGFYIDRIYTAAQRTLAHIEEPEDNSFFSKSFHEHFSEVIKCCKLITEKCQLGNDYKRLYSSLMELFPDIGE